MDRKHNKKITPAAKMLRKTLTKEERHLWYDLLKDYPVRFYRQKVLGNYIADFYCAKAKLIVELDGAQHYQDQGAVQDAVRTAYLEQYDLQIVRFSNRDVNENFCGVCEQIDFLVQRRIKESPPCAREGGTR